MQALVVDDDKAFCQRLKSEIEEVARCLDLHFDIVVTDEAKAVLNSNKVFDLYFIDIEMPGISGLDLITELRRQHVDKEFILVSNHGKYMRQAFFVKPTAFIRKECLRTDLDEVLRFFKNKQIHKNTQVMIKNNAKEVAVYANRLMYCESEGHYINGYYDSDVPFLVRSKLHQSYEVLKKYDFIRIHSRYLVNRNYLESYNKAFVIMRDGKKLPISSTYEQEVSEKLMFWCDRKCAEKKEYTER